MKVTEEPLKCPMNANSTQEDKLDVYQSFLKNVAELTCIDSLPVELTLGPDVTADTLMDHMASWHKSCHLKFSSSKLQKAKKKREADREHLDCRRPFKRQALGAQECIFCGKDGDHGDLHSFTTFDADSHVRTIATELQDTQLLGRIAGGDLIALEAKHHLSCLTQLRNKYRTHERMKKQVCPNTDEKIQESVARVELMSYIKKMVDSGTLMFTPSEIHSLYVSRLEYLGIKKQINKTRLNDDILQHFPEAQDQHDGRNTIIIFKEGLRNLLKTALKQRDYSDDATTLAKAASIIRNDIFNYQGYNFTGNFQANCQENSVPASLKSLIAMILNGQNLKVQDKHDSQASLMISQTIMYNAKKRVSDSEVTRHTLKRDLPLPIYIGISILAATRRRKLIRQLIQMGISISYARVMELEEQIVSSVCKRFEEDGLVSPPCLQKGLFTVGAMDNLYHSPSSVTSMTSFHGAAISLFQFFPTEVDSGEQRQPLTLPSAGNHTHTLPESYSTIPAVALKTSTVAVPEAVTTSAEGGLEAATAEEESWIMHAQPLLDKGSLTKDDPVVWSAYHASKQPRSSSSLFPSSTLL